MSREPLFDGEAFALAVRLQMARENVSMRQLADRIDVDHATLHRVAKHATAPRIETYLRIREWLERSDK